MQTFLPYMDFINSARCLDPKRLGKQRIEALTIYRSIRSQGGWYNHPAVQMWDGYSFQLLQYCYYVCKEWIRRGYNDNLLPVVQDYILHEKGSRDIPPWMSDPRLHSSHRSALLFKNPDWYGKFGWIDEPKIDYFWPSKQKKPWEIRNESRQDE